MPRGLLRPDRWQGAGESVGASYGSGLANPDNALTLYTLLVVVAFLFSPRWGEVRKAVGGKS